ncbi:MAG: hypothetical protein U0798_12565 [Gemmataceae bacterium]
MTTQTNRMTQFQSPAEPAIDGRAVRKAASYVAEMIRDFGPDTVVGTVLSQTLRELRSLEPSAVNTTTVIGPIRIAA